MAREMVKFRNKWWTTAVQDLRDLTDRNLLLKWQKSNNSNWYNITFHQESQKRYFSLLTVVVHSLAAIKLYRAFSLHSWESLSQLNWFSFSARTHLFQQTSWIHLRSKSFYSSYRRAQQKSSTKPVYEFSSRKSCRSTSAWA